MSPSNDFQVALFLALYKQHMEKGFYLVPRRKNLASLARLGIPVKEAKEIVARLTPADYYAGPIQDHSQIESNLWEFLVTVNGQRIYIKISNDFRGACAKCISFHEPERAP